ncbi:hypothetical protein [Streptomyces parvulus]|uniref:hypothetical protein n=1 Tax=Streptomyces parvulus TaxID=146923 RepID=UPI000B03CC45|nr:hypothetical protein [Streptomyces parvulus]GGR74317.1 hypothetical protein GCM10010220_28270 [Streptomyces parvulus]
MAANPVRFSDFTRAEKAQITALTARMALPRANITKLRRQVEAIENKAASRKGK